MNNYNLTKQQAQQQAQQQSQQQSQQQAQQNTMDPKYTCNGENIPPPLTWKNEFPPETKSLALIMCDPDAPNPPFFHWVIQYLPPSIKAINPSTLQLSKPGINSEKTTAYFGPCPPKSDKTPHRYYINLYALSESYQHLPSLPAEQFLYKIKRNVIEKRTLFMKKYTRAQ